MKEEKLFETLAEINEKFILEAEEEPKIKSSTFRIIKPVFVRVIAAGLFLVVGGVMLGIKLTGGNTPYGPNSVHNQGVMPTQFVQNTDYPKKEMPSGTTAVFNSLQQFRTAMDKHNEMGNISSVQTEYDQDLSVVKDFFKALRMEKNVIPYLQGKEMPLREGTNITFYLKEAYGLPWVFYKPYVATTDNFYIKITLIPNEYGATIGETASGLLKKIAPEAVNIGQPGPDNRNVYEKEIKLQGRTVTALVHEYLSDDRNGYLFIYNQMLVWVCCNPEIWGEEWFAGLSFGK